MQRSNHMDIFLEAVPDVTEKLRYEVHAQFEMNYFVYEIFGYMGVW